MKMAKHSRTTRQTLTQRLTEQNLAYRQMDPPLIIPSRYTCLHRFRWKHTPSDFQGIHHTQDTLMKPTTCLKVSSLWINSSTEIHKSFISLSSNHYCQNFHKVLCKVQDQSPACSAVFFTHTVHIQIYKHEADSSKLPFHWGMSTTSPYQHTLTQDDADSPETPRETDSASYYLLMQYWVVHY